MSKDLTHLTLPSGDWLILKVPEGATDIFINNVGCLRYTQGNWSSVVEPAQIGEYLDKDRYQLYGADPLRLTEEECRGIIEPLFSHEDIYGDGKHGNYRHELNLSPMPYKSYTWPQDGLYSSKDTATESFASLLTANGHKQGECVILKKK